MCTIRRGTTALICMSASPHGSGGDSRGFGLQSRCRHRPGRALFAPFLVLWWGEGAALAVAADDGCPGGRSGPRTPHHPSCPSNAHVEATVPKQRPCPSNTGLWYRKCLAIYRCLDTGPGGKEGQTAPAATSTAPAHQRRRSANAETTPAGAPAAAADKTQRPDATCEGKAG